LTSLPAPHNARVPRQQDPPADANPPAAGLNDRERERLEALLDALPAPCEPFDLCALDGFLIGVLLQPEPVPLAAWLAHAHDADGRAPPAALDLTEMHRLVRRRHAELDRAIAARRWFDPWVFELEDDEHGMPASPSEAVLPWVAGFSAALDAFPGLLARAGEAAHEPLAVLFAHFDPDDLEDVDDLLPLIEQIAPPESLDEAVEDLVRCTLLLADATRPLSGGTRGGARGSAGGAAPSQRASSRPPPSRARRG
jgi:uncharacterized protein